MKFLFQLVFSFSFISVAAQISEYSDQIIVKFKNERQEKNNTSSAIEVAKFDISELDNINTKHGALNAFKLNMGKDSKDIVYTIKYRKGEDIEAVIKELEATGLFEYAEPDFIGYATGVSARVVPETGVGEGLRISQPQAPTPQFFPNDIYFSRQWALYNNGSFLCSGCGTYPAPTAKNGADIKMKSAWDITKGSTAVKIGFIDSGCKTDHPEFAGRIWANAGEIPNNGIDEDNNGYKDDVNGWDFQNNDNNPADDNGHGTNTAAIAGANGNNSLGYAGVDWNCKLMITKGLDSAGNGLYSTWVSCIHYLVDNGADIINMSLAGTSLSTTLQSGIDYAYKHGVLVVASMGNDNTGTAHYPAACNHVMAIGATDTDDSRCNPFFWGGGSSYGNWISVCAPGNYIFSLHLSNTNYNSVWGGTSESAPYASGVASLLKAQLPSRNPDQIKAIIEVTADDLGSAGKDDYFGSGRINAHRALSSLENVNNTATDCADLVVFPNPATSGEVLIKLNGNISSELTITDISGKLLWQKTPQDVVNACNYDFSAGLYFVSCRDSLQVVTKKLLIY